MNWKGGRRNAFGYVEVWTGRKYEREHRAVIERHIGRKLLPHESVHHINGVKDDNQIENLELWSSSHPSGQRVQDKVTWAKEILALYQIDCEPLDDNNILYSVNTDR